VPELSDCQEVRVFRVATKRACLNLPERRLTARAFVLRLKTANDGPPEKYISLMICEDDPDCHHDVVPPDCSCEGVGLLCVEEVRAMGLDVKTHNAAKAGIHGITNPLDVPEGARREGAEADMEYFAARLANLSCLVWSTANGRNAQLRNCNPA
jgi:hypothetical protein